jgi:hypothetical protein
MLTGLEAMAEQLCDVDEGTVTVTIMPKQGTPWSPENDPTPFYDAKRRRWRETDRPSWVVPVTVDLTQFGEPGGEATVLGADFCVLAPFIACGMGAIVGRLGRAGAFLVSHSFEVGRRITVENARAVADCGGLLFPSLAVGQVPAYNFGNVALIGDLDLVLQSLRPYKKRGGRWPITVYETDTWTATTREVVGMGSRELFQELTGDPSLNWLYKTDLWVLGPPVSDSPMHQQSTVPLTTTKKLRAALGRRARLYDPSMDAQQLEEARSAHFGTPEAYPYLEAKANGIVPMSCFPVAVAPRGQRKAAEKWLDTAGFEGELLVIAGDLPESYVPPSPDGRDARWDYAWRVRDAVLEMAESSGMVLDVST